MVFITSLDILDTGFLTVTSRSSQLSTSNRVNSGKSLRLKAVNFTVNSTSNLDVAVTPAFFPSDIKNHEQRALVSVNPTTVTLTLHLNTDYSDTSNYYGVNDLELLPYLLKLPHTKGFKAIYYPVTNASINSGASTNNERDKQLVYQLGISDSGSTEDSEAGIGDIDTAYYMKLWHNTAEDTTNDLTKVNYMPIRFNSCQQIQGKSNKITIVLNGVVTG